IGGRFGMNQQAADLGSVEFEGAFQCGDDGMDLSHGQIIGQGAVAAYLDAIGSVAMGAGYEDLVGVENLRKGRGSAAEADFELAVTFDRCRPLNGGGLAFDVGNDSRDSGDFAAHLGFEPGSQGVGVAQGHGLVDFEVLLHVQLVIVLLHADVMDSEVGASGDCADAVVDALSERGDGHGVDDDVGVGKMALDGGGGGG